MNEMVKIIPYGACPNCGGKQFIVKEIQMNKYLTNQDGDILDHREDYYSAAGMCYTCNTVYNMIPTKTGYIPMTKLRSILLDYSDIYNTFPKEKFIKNPMEA